MNLGNLRTNFKEDYPEVDGYWTDDAIDRKFNRAQLRIAYDTLCIQSNVKLDLTADDDDYDLNSLITNFLRIDEEGGVSYYDGSDWERMIATTPDELDETEVDWRTIASGDPEYYYLNSAILYLVAPPDTTRSDALWVYCGLTPTAMTIGQDDATPFNGLSHLGILDELLMDYVSLLLAKSKKQWDSYSRISKIYGATTQVARNWVKGDFYGDLHSDITKVRGYFGRFGRR